MMILMLYMREDAAVVRQPIYGLFLGNIVTVIMAQIIRFHQTVAIVPGQSVSTGFLDEMGILMVWGTSLLYIDAIAIILVYEARTLSAAPYRAALRDLRRRYPELRSGGFLWGAAVVVQRTC